MKGFFINTSMTRNHPYLLADIAWESCAPLCGQGAAAASGLMPPLSPVALQGSAGSLRAQDSQNLLTVRKISVSRMHSLPNDSYMFRPVAPATAPLPLHEVEMETYPCKAQRGTTLTDSSALGQSFGFLTARRRWKGWSVAREGGAAWRDQPGEAQGETSHSSKLLDRMGQGWAVLSGNRVRMRGNSLRLC